MTEEKCINCKFAEVVKSDNHDGVDYFCKYGFKFVSYRVKAMYHCPKEVTK